MDSFPVDAVLQAMAAENNLAETAFLVRQAGETSGATARSSGPYRSPCGRERRGRRQLVPGLPGWTDRSTLRLQDRVDIRGTERRRCIAKCLLAIVPMDGPAACFCRDRQGLAIHDRVGDHLRAMVGDPFLDRLRQHGTTTDRNARYGGRYCLSQRIETFACAARGGLMHALDEGHGFSYRNWTRPWAVQITTDCPRSFVMIRLGRQAAGKVDAPAIEHLAIWCNGNQQCRIAMLHDTDCRGAPGSARHDVRFKRCHR